MTQEQETAKEDLGQAIDSVDNLAHALILPMPADFHVKAMKESLPEVVKRLKESYAKAFNENPWNE
jgi:hypothetical protein